jgi:5-methyltetrahydrofolate--homocysteine methyltransferase
MKPQDADGFLSAARRRILIFDGGMGTTLERLGAEPGACKELLNETRPDLVQQAHAEFLTAGAEVIETNSFGAARHILAEYGLAGRCFDLNRRAAAIARKALTDCPGRTTPRFVAGSIGPGSKLPSLGQIDVDELKVGYAPQIEGLLAGGVDCLIVETGQDLLQMRTVLAVIEEVLGRRGKRVPVIAQVTIGEHGRMLAGSDVPAVLATLEPFPVAAIGLNCGPGPEGMAAAVRYMAEYSSKLLSVMPNAGLPRLVKGGATYDLMPGDFARQMQAFALGPGLNIAGGCCGTTPEHIRALACTLKGVRPRKPVAPVPRVSSLFSAQELAVEPRPLICGERTNASGSKGFRASLLRRDFDGMVATARAQADEGAHVIDLSVAAAGRDELADMKELCYRLNRSLALPVMVDSTLPEVVEAALSRLAGRCIVNSAHLDDEDRARQTIELCRRHGAALVLLAIDRAGMAMTAERKLEVAVKLYDLAVKQGGLAPESLFFDFLTFTLASGDPSLADAAVETLKAVKAAKRRFPRSFTLLGVSNVSHGLEPQARRALNTVFLARAIEHGLDAAILHAGRIEPLSALEPGAVLTCDDVVFNRPGRGRSPLERFLDYFSRRREKPAAALAPDGVTAAERLRRAVLAGDKTAVTGVLPELLKLRKPLAVIEDLLLPAMAEVGRQFEAGGMQLPFVLRSAEAMQAAFAVLRPVLGRRSRPRGTLLIATVRGDVHDIGKNLVDMIVSSNGFRVVNLGVRRTAEDIIAAAGQERPDAIGLSGLLVESARAMKEYLQAFAASGIGIPVICGGAALTRDYVEKELRAEYPAGVYYAKDAMAGLALMQSISRSAPAASRPGPEPDRKSHKDAKASEERGTMDFSAYRHQTKTMHAAADRIQKLLDRDALFCRRWKLLKPGAPKEDRDKAEELLVRLLRVYREQGVWHGAGIYGVFTARAEGPGLVLAHPGNGEELTRLRFSKSFSSRLAGRFGAKQLYVVLQLVTLGDKVGALADRLAKQGRVHDQFLLHGLAAELTEALARLSQKELPGLPGWKKTERYSPGYPAWPDLSEQQKVFTLLGASRIGVSLTETFQIVPEYSTSAIILPD